MSHALINAWNATLRRSGGERAVVQAADGQSWTFRELDERASSWQSTHVPEPRVLAGRPVVFAAPNGIEWLEVFIGLQRAGAVVVALDASEPPGAQRHVAEVLRAACWWDGSRLVPLEGTKRFRDPSLCLIKMTSGTTGQPRPLVFKAAQLLADAQQVTSTMRIGPHDLNYGLIPLGHSYGLGNLTIPLLSQGVPLVCATVPLPQPIMDDFARWRPTVFPSVPAIWRALVATDGKLESLRLGISAGAPLSTEVAMNFAEKFGPRLHGFYGSSETGGIAFDRDGSATLVGGVGRALRGVQLRTLRGSRLRVRSAAVYTHGNRLTDVFGEWIMSDRVSVDVRGRVTLRGRIGTTVKIAGRRLNLAEVTVSVRKLPGVLEAWVGVRPGAEPLLGVVVVTERTVTELRSAMHISTAAWKIPKKWITLPTLPLTARGKTDARALQAMLFGESDARVIGRPMTSGRGAHGSTPKSK